MVGHAVIVLTINGAPAPRQSKHVDITRSKVKVKVTGLLNFRKLTKIALFWVYLLRHFDVELKTDD